MVVKLSVLQLTAFKKNKAQIQIKYIFLRDILYDFSNT